MIQILVLQYLSQFYEFCNFQKKKKKRNSKMFVTLPEHYKTFISRLIFLNFLKILNLYFRYRFNILKTLTNFNVTSRKNFNKTQQKLIGLFKKKIIFSFDFHFCCQFLNRLQIGETLSQKKISECLCVQYFCK